MQFKRIYRALLASHQAAVAWANKPIRVIGVLILAVMPQACAFCVRDPINPQAQQHTAFCAQYYQEGKLTEAEARCRLAREFAPKYAEPVNLLGLIEYTRGHMDRARTFFKEALSLRDDFAEAHNNLGAIFMDERDFGYACDEFKQAIEIDPGYVNARVNLALCKFYGGHADDARAEYLKCVELQPKACDCRQGLGVLAASKKDYDSAKVEFQKMTEVCPEDPIGFYNLCQTYFDMGQCGNALEACMKAIAIKSDYLEARKNLTAATECLALEDGAIKEYTDKIKRNPGDAELHFNLGVVYSDKHLVEASLNEFLSTIKLKPDYALAYYRAARIYDDQVRTDDTIRMCKEFVDLLRGEKLAEQRDWCINRVKELQYR
ncbi:MAG TPA: tetratricopeptide repeat protein [Myxococcota bacterium]|nr:tetratricopeptide repeat protein [Myxococcota bacterium]